MMNCSHLEGNVVMVKALGETVVTAAGVFESVRGWCPRRLTDCSLWCWLVSLTKRERKVQMCKYFGQDMGWAPRPLNNYSERLVGPVQPQGRVGSNPAHFSPAGTIGPPAPRWRWRQSSHVNIRAQTKKLWDWELEWVHTRGCGPLIDLQPFPSPRAPYQPNHVLVII